ncbi:NAD(P)-binding protein [Salimicrobium album]|uniref:precorrin-2 dehydrogenase n=1 Tax=Salimicrobium album TaxID=50717 RepID=A0A1H3GYC8_9BACI|nr:NAD(P)-binding protein [Salimicrobium album]SDY08127.1 precorrin-2 dehydrogenase / sirohydrochlorin ferrochelatase [Salimicrobium album]
MSHLPLTVDMKGKMVVIVGGGPVAEKRAKKLLDAEASITIVSPEVTPDLEYLAGEERFYWKRRTFEPRDIEGVFLLIAATGNRQVDEEVKKAGENVPLVNIAGEADAGNIHFPAHFSRGRLSIAVSTGGASPALAARIKSRLEEDYDEDYGAYLDFLHVCRTTIKTSGLSKEKKKEAIKKLLDEEYEEEKEQARMVAWLEGIE